MTRRKKKTLNDVAEGVTGNDTNWKEFTTDQLRQKLLFATQIVIPGVIVPAMNDGDERTPAILARWEADRVAIVKELKARNALQNVTVGVKPARLHAKKGD